MISSYTDILYWKYLRRHSKHWSSISKAIYSNIQTPCLNKKKLSISHSTNDHTRGRGAMQSCSVFVHLNFYLWSFLTYMSLFYITWLSFALWVWSTERLILCNTIVFVTISTGLLVFFRCRGVRRGIIFLIFDNGVS